MSRGRYSPRAVAKVLDAASRVEVDNMREAAILGGLVQSLITTGTLSQHYVAHATKAALDWAVAGHSTMQAEQLFPDRRKPTKAEMDEIAARFRAEYDPGSSTSAS